MGFISNPIQNCIDFVGEKAYSFQEMVCGLCDTDTKVYALLILGRTLQAAALVSFAASITFTFFAGPVSLIGVAPALALGILGTYVAGNPQEIGDKLKMGRPFVSGQPIGLVNRGSNCWVNAGLQVLANIPSFQNRLRQIPVLAQFLDHYAAAGQNRQKIAPNIDTQTIRQFLSQQTGGRIRSGPYQEDAAELLEFIFQGEHAPYLFDQQTDGGVALTRHEPMIQITLGQQQPRPNFQELFNLYFDHRTDIGQHVKLSFQRAPDDLLIQLKRFFQQGDQQGKIIDPIDVPERIIIPNPYVRTNETPQYLCDGFLIHYGVTQDVGHYVACIKKANTWWWCSDTAVYEISAAQALEEMKQSYICHFRKVT